jgi:putative heme-binding domain-containing protein
VVRVLESTDAGHRYAARRALRARPTEEVLTALDAWLAGPASSSPAIEHHRLEALWVQQHLGQVDPQLLERVLTSAEPRARAAGIRALCYLRDEIDGAVDKLVRAADDEYPLVRLEAVRAASFLSGPEGDRVVRAVMQHPLDYYLQYVIQETATTLEERGGESGIAGKVAAERLAAGGIQEDQVRPLVELAAPHADAQAFSAIFAAVVAAQTYSNQTKQEVMDELRRESATRRQRPTLAAQNVLGHVVNALENGEADLAGHVLQLAAAWHVDGDVDDFLRIALDSRTPNDAAQNALAVLAASPVGDANATLHELTQSSTDPETLLRAAAALAEFDLGISCAALAKALTLGSTDYDAIHPAVAAILRRESAAEVLRERVAVAKLAQDPARVLLRAVYAVGNSDADLTSIVMKAAGIDETKPLSDEEKLQLAHRIDTEGDAHAGELTYRRADLNCQKCHAISGAGGNIGPDLSGVGATSPTIYLLDSILNPSLQIKEAFATRTIFTDEGKVYTGVVVESTPERVILRDAEGDEFTIPAEQIDEQDDGPSLMPEGQQHLMTSQELVDLVKFLTELGKPGEYAVNRRPVVLRYKVLNDEAVERWSRGRRGIERRLARLPDDAWTTRYALVSGRLPLADVFTDAQDRAILRADVNVTVAGPLTVRLDPPVDARAFAGRERINADGSAAMELDVGQHSVYVILNEKPDYEHLTMAIEVPDGAATQHTIIAGE